MVWSPEPAELPAPRQGEVHVWKLVLPVSPKALAGCEALLSEDELLRMGKFVFEIDRQRFAVGRGSLRRLLGGFLGVAPRQLVFKLDPGGRPVLADGRLARKIGFNVSHSGALVLLAFAAQADVGIDVEKLDREVDADLIVRQAFSPEDQDAIAQAPEAERRLEFMTRWTCKEAAIKSTGAGLGVPLDSVRLDLAKDRETALIGSRDGSAPSVVAIMRFGPMEGYAAAVATEAGLDRPRLRFWDPRAGEP